MTETEWLEVSDILIRYFPVLKDKDGIVMSLWHKRLKCFFKEDVIKAIEHYAVKDKKPSISGIIEMLNAWKVSIDEQQVQKPYDTEIMSYVVPLRKRFPARTDDELIDIQNTCSRLNAYFSIINGKIPLDNAMAMAIEHESEIKQFINSLPKDTLYIYKQALRVDTGSAYSEWLIWRVFHVEQKGYPFYYNIRTKRDHHCITDEQATMEMSQLWLSALQEARKPTELAVREEKPLADIAETVIPQKSDWRPDNYDDGGFEIRDEDIPF